MTDDENSDGRLEALLNGAVLNVVEEGERAFREAGREAICPYLPPPESSGRFPSASELGAVISRRLWYHGWWLGFRETVLGCKRKEP